MMRVVLFVTLVLVNLLAHSRATGTTRSLVECAPFAIKLEGGTPPYRVAGSFETSFLIEDLRRL